MIGLLRHGELMAALSGAEWLVALVVLALLVVVGGWLRSRGYE